MNRIVTALFLSACLSGCASLLSDGDLEKLEKAEALTLCRDDLHVAKLIQDDLSAKYSFHPRIRKLGKNIERANRGYGLGGSDSDRYRRSALTYISRINDWEFEGPRKEKQPANQMRLDNPLHVPSRNVFPDHNP